MTPSGRTPELEFPDLDGFLPRARGEGGLFLSGQPLYLARSPGRLDLMGGNDDYSGGLVFEITIREATRAAAQRRPDRLIVLANPHARFQGWSGRVEYQLDDLLQDGRACPLEQVQRLVAATPAQAWTAYVLGGLYLLLKEFPDRLTNGLALYLESDVPIGAGVSSSAALEVASLKAAGAAYGLQLEGVDLATRCQWVENAIACSASGVMDQIAVVLGDQDAFVPLLCQPCLPRPLVRLPAPLRCWGIDSGVRHAVAGIAYEAARAATFMGYQMICHQEELPLSLDESGPLARWTDPRWHGYLANLPPPEFRARYEAGLPERLPGAAFLARYGLHADPYTPVRPEVLYPVRAATRYAVEENQRVHEFVDLLSAPLSPPTLARLGELMYASHAAYSECGLGSPATDRIVALVRSEGRASGLYGAKITGGGAGGTVAVLGEQGAAAEAAFRRVVRRYSQETGAPPIVFEGSSPGADRFGVREVRF